MYKQLQALRIVDTVSCNKNGSSPKIAFFRPTISSNIIDRVADQLIPSLNVQSHMAGSISYNLPTASEFASDKFYIRGCYSAYYDYIIQNLRMGRRYISVTGTPGIGKSLFYIYFFKRYQEEFPMRDIVTASFSCNRKIKTCTVFKQDQEKSVKVTVHRGTIAYVVGALYLYDGPPEVEPDGEQMICFTSHNSDWFRNMKKIDFHTKLVMPRWDLDEILEANEALGRQVDIEEVITRFRFFGGIARFCLSTETDFVEDAETTIREKIRSIESFTILRDCFVDTSYYVDDIFHMIPVMGSSHPRNFVYDFASSEVKSLVLKNLLYSHDQDRELFVQRMRGQSVTASLVESFRLLGTGCSDSKCIPLSAKEP